MKPSFDDILQLFTRVHGKDPTDAQRQHLRRKLRHGLVCEPPWERLVRPTTLGPSWLGLLWWVLDAGPAVDHPGVVAALEVVRGGCEAVAGPSPGERRDALAGALGVLVAGERQPLVPIDVALRIDHRPGSCGQCGGDVPAGLVGWYAGCDEGPLCQDCLQENAPSLAVLLDAVLLGLPEALFLAGRAIPRLDDAWDGDAAAKQGRGVADESESIATENSGS